MSSLRVHGDFMGVHNIIICPKYTSECYVLSAHMVFSYIKKNNANSKVKATAQVFGLPYCGFLIFGGGGQNSGYPWCISWVRVHKNLV